MCYPKEYSSKSDCMQKRAEEKFKDNSLLGVITMATSPLPALYYFFYTSNSDSFQMSIPGALLEVLHLIGFFCIVYSIYRSQIISPGKLRRLLMLIHSAFLVFAMCSSILGAVPAVQDNDFINYLSFCSPFSYALLLVTAGLVLIKKRQTSLSAAFLLLPGLCLPFYFIAYVLDQDTGIKWTYTILALYHAFSFFVVGFSIWLFSKTSFHFNLKEEDIRM
jgi:hypothetical protein